MSVSASGGEASFDAAGLGGFARARAVPSEDANDPEDPLVLADLITFETAELHLAVAFK